MCLLSQQFHFDAFVFLFNTEYANKILQIDNQGQAFLKFIGEFLVGRERSQT